MRPTTTRNGAAALPAADPVDGEDLLVTALFGGQGQQGRRPATSVRGHASARVPSQAREDEVVCVLLRRSDVDLLDRLVAQRRRAGHLQASRDHVVAAALAALNRLAI